MLEEQEAWDGDDEEEINEETMTSGEDINRINEDAERDDDVSAGYEDVDRDAIRGGGSSEAEKRYSGGSDKYKDEESLEAHGGF